MPRETTKPCFSVILRKLLLAGYTLLLLHAFHASAKAFSLPTGFQEAEPPRVEREIEGEGVEFNRELSPEEKEKAGWEQRHPGESYENYKYLLDLGKKEATRAVHEGKNLLRSDAATGWAYKGSSDFRADQSTADYVKPMPGTETAFQYLPLWLETKFVLVGGGYPFPVEKKSPPNVIEFTSIATFENLDLTPFYVVNQRFLRDAGPLYGSRYYGSSMRHTKDLGGDAKAIDNYHADLENRRLGDIAKLEESKFAVLTSARLSNGTEIVTLFDLSEATRNHALRGETFVLDLADQRKERNAFPPGSFLATATSAEAALENRLKALASKRIYTYGAQPKNIDLSLIADRNGLELVRRGENSDRDLFLMETRLRQIERRALNEDDIVITDGLPKFDEVDALGPFIGSAEAWQGFRDSVENQLNSMRSRHVDSKTALLKELSEGESDVLVLVAHSTGSRLYLGGETISMDELMRLPPRRHHLVRPRLAVLLSCDTGKSANSELPVWRRMFRSEVFPLAKILVEKGYFDRAIAPDHKIGKGETIEVLRQIASGTRTGALLKGWVDWAINLLRNRGATV